MHSSFRVTPITALAFGLFLFYFFATPVLATADGNSPADIQITPQPVSYIFVDGDAGTFQAHHWVQEGYTGGIKKFSSDLELKNDITVTAEGHALMDQGDYEAHYGIKQGDLWHFFIHYEQFRKYFDSIGGTYHPFGALAVGRYNTGYKRDLHVDIGKLEVEFGIKPEHFPELTFFYERHFKEGTKSRLTWGAVRVGSTTRMIAPAFQEIAETVDTFKVRANDELKGFQWSAEQEFEYFGAESMREERSDTNNLIRRQTQNPRAFMAASTFEVDRWFWKDRAHVSNGYRISHINNDEFERIRELDINYMPRSFSSSAHNRINAIAENDLDTHTWVASLLVAPVKWLSTTTRFKAEQFRHKGHSVYPSDVTDPPDNLPNTTEVSDTLSKGGRFGESFSIRFTKIPRTTLYNELEFEQARFNMREDRKSVAGQSSANANETFGRDTLSQVFRGSWTLGSRVKPVSFVDVTSQIRYRSDSNNYDDRRETAPGGSTARSAFFDGQHRDVSEFTTRVSLKAVRWFEPAVRYQLQDVKYATRFEGQPIVKTSALSHIYTFDITSNPLDELLFTGSFSRQTSATMTPADLSATANTPTFNADVDSWLLSGSYSFSEKVVASSMFIYSFSNNFNDFTATGLPLGVDDERLEVSMELAWTVSERLTLEPKYAFYRYQANSNADAGDYNAHLITLEATVAWG